MPYVHNHLIPRENRTTLVTGIPDFVAVYLAKQWVILFQTNPRKHLSTTLDIGTDRTLHKLDPTYASLVTYTICYIDRCTMSLLGDVCPMTQAASLLNTPRWWEDSPSTFQIQTLPTTWRTCWKELMKRRN